MKEDEQDMEFYLQQEKDSAAMDGHGFDENAFREAWREAMKNKDGLSSELEKLRTTPIAPKDVKLWNPRLSEVRGEHDLLNADLETLSRNGIIYVGDLTSITKDKLKETHQTLLEKGLRNDLTFREFKETIKDLSNTFPKAHYFLAQPIKEIFVGRPDGGRDGSGMMM